jgi:hypothetical protein
MIVERKFIHECGKVRHHTHHNTGQAQTAADACVCNMQGAADAAAGTSAHIHGMSPRSMLEGQAQQGMC